MMTARNLFQRLRAWWLDRTYGRENGDSPIAKEWQRLQEHLSYQFRDLHLLARALTHRSYANEKGKNFLDYESMEFLGDSVLDLALGHELMRRFPSSPEGDLTRMRASLVSEPMLARMARAIDLGACLRMGRGEARTGGREKDSILSDAYEALIGAVFLDGGFQKAEGSIIHLFRLPLEEVGKVDFHRDFKSEIQQWAQEHYRKAPEYMVTDQWGPAHQRGFRVELRVQGKVLGMGTGSSKKEAEQEAARSALDRLQAGNHCDDSLP